MSTVGDNIKETERLTAEATGSKYAVALSSGTAALHLAVKLAGLKPGDHVLCSDLTFNATVNPVVYEGGEPAFIDAEYETYILDRTWKGTDHTASLEPDGIKQLVQDLNDVHEALTYKSSEILPIEQEQRDKLKYRKH